MNPDSLDLDPELIQERLRWARTQGHPFYLWPDMPVGEWRASLREIERVTTDILADGSPPVLALPPAVDARKMHEINYEAQGGSFAYVLRELEYNREANEYEPDSSLYIAATSGPRLQRCANLEHTIYGPRFPQQPFPAKTRKWLLNRNQKTLFLNHKNPASLKMAGPARTSLFATNTSVKKPALTNR